jgi:hypothetical protein
MMGFIGPFFLVLKKLNEGEIPYMVVGSFASMVYGEPRMTHDVDIVIDILPGDARKLNQLFSSEEFYIPPKEVINAEIINRGQFNLIHHESGIKIDFIIRKNGEHSKSEFARKCKSSFWPEGEVYLASPEDVIIKKLDFFREGGSEKHLRDIRGILAHTEIDKSYLEFWISKLGLSQEWKMV